MNKYFSRSALIITALSAVFFSSPAFAVLDTPSPLVSSANPCFRTPMAYVYMWGVALGTSGGYGWNTKYGALSFAYIDTSNNFKYFVPSGSNPVLSTTIPNVQCFSFLWASSTTSSAYYGRHGYIVKTDGSIVNITVNATNWSITQWSAYSGTYYTWSLDYDSSNGRFSLPSSFNTAFAHNKAFYLSGWLLYYATNGSTTSPTYAVWPNSLFTNASLPVNCATDNIASGGTCSCKASSTPTGTSWSGSAKSFTYGGSSIASTTTKTSSWLFSGQFSSYSIYKVNSEWYKPNDLLWEILVSAENSHADAIVFSNTGGVVWNNNYVSFSNDNGYIKFYTSSSFSSGTENNFNSFYINSSTGAVTSYFKVYYWENNSIDPEKYLWIYQTNQLITLPNELKTRSIKIVPASNINFYIWGVSLWNVSYVYGNVCTNLSASGALAELASRSTLSGSTNIANVNFCSSSFDVPYIGSALGAMCNFVQPLIKPLVWGFQTTVDMINIVPPSTAPTTFDYYPSFTFSGMTMHISTQTGAIPVYSSWSDVNPLKITSNEASSNMKIWVLALISILLYLVVYALHFWIVAGLVWLLLHISRFFTGFLWKHSGTGNIWSLAPFLVYAWVFFTALLSLIASVSFLLPLLQVIRAYALFLITWLTSFAPWSYALFSGFYIVVFSSIFLVGTFYLIYVLFEKHSRLN